MIRISGVEQDEEAREGPVMNDVEDADEAVVAAGVVVAWVWKPSESSAEKRPSMADRSLKPIKVDC